MYMKVIQNQYQQKNPW